MGPVWTWKKQKFMKYKNFLLDKSVNFLNLIKTMFYENSHIKNVTFRF